MMRSRLGWTCALLFLAASLWVAPVAATEIEPGIYRLDGLDETLPHDDLEPLERIIGKAEIVGLGEAVHTVGDFYQAKFRIFKYLVEELGFRAFGFESPWIKAERVARYVQDCEGSPGDAIRGLFGVWQGESVRDLVLWMCEWNREHPDDRVHFYGFDIQQRGDLSRLRRLLMKFGLDQADPRLNELFRCLSGGSRDGHDRCLVTLDAIEAYLDENAAAIARATSAEDLAWARVHAVGIRAFEDQLWYMDRDFERSFEARDAGMAYVAAEIRRLRFPEARTAFWAHNVHIATGRMFGPDVMGGFLKKAFKRKYRVIGIIAHEAAIDWPGISCGIWKTASDGSVEGLLRELGEPYLLVDLKFPGGEPPFLAKGRRYEFNWDYRIAPKRRFDALVYLESAEKMKPLAWRPCTP